MKFKIIEAFIHSQLPQILRKERSNEQRICLYQVGGYWLAFERSAYKLRQAFNDSQVFVTSHIAYPFPIVVSSISDETLRHYGNTHTFGCNYPNYKELAYLPTDADKYTAWYKNETKEYNEARALLRQEEAPYSK